MSTLHDLRATLEEHADALHDTERYLRPVAVRARVRAVRRRRTTLAAALAVVVVLVGVSTVGALRGPGEVQPASRVVGVDVPRTVDVLGFPYALRELHPIDHDLHLQPSDREQAVILAASDLGTGSATLYVDGDAVARVRGDQRATVPYPLGDGGNQLEVRLDGAGAGARAGVALYQATGELAEGTRNADGTAVFRESLAGEPLLAAGFAAAGDPALELRARGALDAMRFVFYCTGGDGLWLNIAVDGDGPVSSSCSGANRDAATGTSTTLDGPAPVRDHRVRVYLTRGSDGPEVAPSGVEYGAGIYQRTATTRSVRGNHIDTRVEYQGRTWVLDDVRSAPATIDTGAGDRLLNLVGRGKQVSVSWSGRLDADRSASMGSSVGSGVMGAGVLLAGDVYRVTVRGGAGSLLVYRPE